MDKHDFFDEHSFEEKEPVSRDNTRQEGEESHRVSPCQELFFGLGLVFLLVACVACVSFVASDAVDPAFVDYRMQVTCKKLETSESCGSLVRSVTAFAENSGVDIDRIRVDEISNTGVSVYVQMEASAAKASLTKLERHLVKSGFEFRIISR
ncbi:hypothetical protein [Roseibium sp. RKSG952]|uniref:hypothetical protein n=1 Tax=Roseibium sp. RKSG952 TaxID=2529384 RepID=UPI0012BD2946|nr:hypothetical protein [Roseibium sp. RKSG952]MTH97602.1 hypothetical protein [Roseibium sp. RKSG952]